MPETFDILVVGAGPAGIAAALSASENRGRIGLLDENALPGGQIYRASNNRPHKKVAAQLSELERRGVSLLSSTTVIDSASSGTLLVSSPAGVCSIQYEKLILATGARELFLPFPGWTLPNAMGVGGLQTLVKSGLNVAGKRIVVAGSGPLLLAVGAYLKAHGAEIVVIAEQTSTRKLAQFTRFLSRFPGKLIQGAGLMASIGSRLKRDTWVVAAGGNGKLEWVQLNRESDGLRLKCDYLACAYGFVPNIELPVLLGCEIENGFVGVDDFQETSVKSVFCAGEPTGIGGIDLSVIEGRIAGYAAAGSEEKARHLFPARSKWRLFAEKLNRTYRLRDDIRELTRPDTIVCRCEDVCASQLERWESSRAAKLHTRCGMGPCQGRICGPATGYLYGWEHGTVRPPLSPMPLAGYETDLEAAIKSAN